MISSHLHCLLWRQMSNDDVKWLRLSPPCVKRGTLLPSLPVAKRRFTGLKMRFFPLTTFDCGNSENADTNTRKAVNCCHFIHTRLWPLVTLIYICRNVAGCWSRLARRIATYFCTRILIIMIIIITFDDRVRFHDFPFFSWNRGLTSDGVDIFLNEEWIFSDIVYILN